MSRAIGSGIVLNIFLASCRGRFFRSTFGTTHQRRWFLVISCISSGLLASFPFIASVTGLEGLLYTNPTVGFSYLSLLGALLSITCILYLLLGSYPTRTTVKISLQFLILGCGIYLATHFTPWAGIVSRALIAGIEEWTKTTTTLALNDRFSFLSSDIIFFGLLSALGFAFIENIVYLRDLGTTTIGGAFGLVIKRMLTSWVMHLCYTGMIAIGITLLSSSSTKYLQGSALIAGGILVHTLFNSFLTSAHIAITVLIIIFGYLFMSRLVYRSERVYIS